MENEESLYFEDIVSKYIDDIYNFSFRLSGNSAEAEDITQEVFIKVWKNLKKYNSNKSFKTWILTIARNTFIDFTRKKKNILFSKLDSKDLEFEETIPDLEPLPNEIFEREELSKDLEKALLKIPENYKIVILLHDLENMTFEEIGKIVDKPTNTVKSQYRRGLLALRRYFS